MIKITGGENSMGRGAFVKLFIHERCLFMCLRWNHLGHLGRDLLRSVGFYIKCTQSRSTTTLKSNFLNSLIFIFISPREPKETFGCFFYCHRTLFHVGQILSKWALSWVWGLADGPDAHPFPYFSFKHPASSWRQAGHISPAFLFSKTCVTKSLSRPRSSWG